MARATREFMDCLLEASLSRTRNKFLVRGLVRGIIRERERERNL